MPIFVYVLLGIALLITLLLISKVKLFVCYDDSLRIYAKFLFIKFDIIPSKVKKPKKEKKKKRKKKADAPRTPSSTPAEPKKEKSVVAKLWELREALMSIVGKFFSKLVFKFIKLRIVVACENACSTALAYGGVTQCVAYIIEILDNISNVKVENNSDIKVESDFTSQKSEFECKIELYLRIISIISVGLHALKVYIKSQTED